jgi:hypothetical protein
VTTQSNIGTQENALSITRNQSNVPDDKYICGAMTSNNASVVKIDPGRDSCQEKTVTYQTADGTNQDSFRRKFLASLIAAAGGNKKSWTIRAVAVSSSKGHPPAS